MGDALAMHRAGAGRGFSWHVLSRRGLWDPSGGTLGRKLESWDAEVRLGISSLWAWKPLFLRGRGKKRGPWSEPPGVPTPTAG